MTVVAAQPWGQDASALQILPIRSQRWVQQPAGGPLQHRRSSQKLTMQDAELSTLSAQVSGDSDDDDAGQLEEEIEIGPKRRAAEQ